MSVTLRGAVMVEASIGTTWSALIDWHGQEDWIPMTTMRVLGDRTTGIGTRIKAFHGLGHGSPPIGLIDNFVVTDWHEPTTVEVTHLGPYFTGIGLFSLAYRGEAKTWVNVVEVFDLPLAPVTELGARVAAPLLHRGLQFALAAFARTVESGGDGAEAAAGV